jgi:parallel beta-helix repeat protein
MRHTGKSGRGNMDRYKRLVMAVLIGSLFSIAGIWMIAGTGAVVSVPVVISTEVPADDHYLYFPLGVKNYTVQHRWGDWIVTGAETVENVDIRLNGNIFLEHGGSLTLRNVRLTMDCSYEGEYGLFVNPGSSLSIYDSVIEPSDEENTYEFAVEDARLVLRSNEIRGVGSEWGLWISARDAIIEGNTIYHGANRGITLQNSQGALIRGNVVHSLVEVVGNEEVGSGIELENSHNNQIIENYLRNQLHPLGIYGSWNNLVADNEVTLKSHSSGIVVGNGSGNNIVANNTFTKDPAAEWA